jgi:hypothetical protein
MPLKRTASDAELEEKEAKRAEIEESETLSQTDPSMIWDLALEILFVWLLATRLQALSS